MTIRIAKIKSEALATSRRRLFKSIASILGYEWRR
jgi:hypothetical protein